MYKVDYEKYIETSFRIAQEFFDKHKYPRSDAEWDAIAADLSGYRTPFATALLVAVIDEIERDYNHIQGIKQNKKEITP